MVPKHACQPPLPASFTPLPTLHHARLPPTCTTARGRYAPLPAAPGKEPNTLTPGRAVGDVENGRCMRCELPSWAPAAGTAFLTPAALPVILSRALLSRLTSCCDLHTCHLALLYGGTITSRWPLICRIVLADAQPFSRWVSGLALPSQTRAKAYYSPLCELSREATASASPCWRLFSIISWRNALHARLRATELRKQRLATTATARACRNIFGAARTARRGEAAKGLKFRWHAHSAALRYRARTATWLHGASCPR